MPDLYVSTTGTDSDWVVKLIDVYPGRLPRPLDQPRPVSRWAASSNSSAGDVMRGKFRDSYEDPKPFEPGKPTPVRMKMNDIYHTFRPGHRIMVQVQSTWFPMVDRNPQSFVDIYSAKPTDFRKATQRLYHSEDMVSSLGVLVEP